MLTSDDRTLLHAWAQHASQDPFAALARRYAGLLYHAGLRTTGRADLAEEAAQNALAILARKAARVSPGKNREKRKNTEKQATPITEKPEKHGKTGHTNN